MFTLAVPVQSRTRMLYLPYILLALLTGLWTTSAAAVYLTVPYHIEYYRAFSGNYSINLRKDSVVFGDALIYSLAVKPMSAAVSNVNAKGLCIQFTVDASKLTQDSNTTVLEYTVGYEGTTGGTQSSSGILDLRASNSGFSPPNTQECGALPETNHVPSFNSSIAAQVAPGRTFSRDLSKSVVDADPADLLTISLAQGTVARYGSVTLAGNVLNYTANSNVPSGSTEMLGLVVTDGRGGVGTSSATFTINTAPVAKDVAVNAVTGQATTIDVSKLVADGDGDALAVYSLTAPAHGTATFSGLTITYTSSATYSGPDEFMYWITDNKGGATSAKISATVSAPNLPPVANNGEIRIQEDVSTDIDLATYASDPEGSFAVSAIPTAPQHGTASFTGTHITYTPALNYYGNDTFTYQVSDPQGASATATLSMIIAPVNDPPLIQANPLERRVAANSVLTIDLTANVSDPDGNVVIVSDTTGPQHGQITRGTGLSITYTPSPGYIGADQFNYYLSDQTNTNNSTAMGTVVIDVSKANTPPLAENLNTNATAGQSVVINLANAVTDQDKDPLTLTIVKPPAHGTAQVVDSSAYAISYLPNPGFSGEDQFDYSVSDGFGGSATATITLKIAAVTPLAQALNIKILGGDVQLARLNTNAALSAQVTDETGQPLAGISVDWSATEPGGAQPSIVATDPVTDSSGIARATLTTSNSPTSYTVTVTALLLSAETSQQATFTIATGLHALTKPGTPEGALAGVLDSMCPAMQAVAGTLTASQQSLLERCNEILNAATDGNDAQIVAALRALAPDEAAASGRIGSSFGQQQLSNIGSRLSALRSGASGLGLSGLSFNIKGRVVPGSVFMQSLEPDANTTPAVDLPVPKWGGFISGTVGGGDKTRTASEEGFNFHTRGITAGADYRYSSAVVYGGALGYARSDVNLDADGGGLDANALSLSLYGTYYRTQSFYLDAVLNYAANNYDQTRNIDYYAGSTHIQKTARSDSGGKLLALSVGGGYEFTSKNGASAEVSLRLHRIASTIDGYTETGADALNLALRDQDIRVLSSSLGTRGSWPLSLKWGVLIPQLDMSWEHELNGGAHKITGSFVNDPFATPFTFKTDDPDRNYFQLGLGVSAIIPGGKTAFLQYQTNLGRDHYRDYNVALGARVELR